MTEPGFVRRRVVDWTARVLAMACVVVALVPLLSILWTATVLGGPRLLEGWSFLTGAFPDPCTPGITEGCSYGGIGPALQGTLILVGVAGLIAIPTGILGGIYVSEFGRNRFGRTLSFLADVLSGTPSIVVGLFAFSTFLALDRTLIFSTLDGAFALAVIMLPVVVRTTEESLRLVPRSVREGAFSLGIPRFRTTLRIVLPTGGAAVVTGALLATARAAGEAAPLLFTSFAIETQLGFQGLDQPINAIPPLIYLWGYGEPYGNWKSDAWGMALLLILMMLAISLSARWVLARRANLIGGMT
ncbi:MAG TPA: phosphate ABC transporter permease PstA [Thermoplasmata archaeon]